MRRAQDQARSARSRKNRARSVTFKNSGTRSATIESRALGALKLASEARVENVPAKRADFFLLFFGKNNISIIQSIFLRYLLYLWKSFAGCVRTRVAKKEEAEVPYVIVLNSKILTCSAESSRHNILWYFLSSGWTFIIRYILAISAVNAQAWDRNHTSNEKRSSCIVGPVINVSLSDRPLAVLAEASKTTRSFVVRLDSLITG